MDYTALAVELAAAPPRNLSAERRAPAVLSPDAGSRGEREVVVQFSDAAASEVCIAGDFNGWIPDKGVESRLADDGSERVWTKILHLPPGTYQYRYVVDGEWREDPHNPQVVSGPVGGRYSILVVS